MQFDDPKSVLEAAAAKPSRRVDAAALVRRGARMRRTRLAAATAGLAVVVAGASASFGLLGAEREGGPGPAGRACGDPDRRVSLFLEDDAGRAEVDAMRRDLQANPDVADLEYVSREEALEEFYKLYDKQPPFDSPPPGALPRSFRIEAANDAGARRLAAIKSPIVDEVVADPGGEPFACFVERACARPEAFEASIFLRDDASRRDVAGLKAELRADPAVVELRHLTKREAYEEFRELYSDRLDFLDTVPRDALPASLRIEVADEAALQRVVGVESRVVDEIVHNLGDRRRLCRGPEEEADEHEVAVPEPSAPGAADRTGAPAAAPVPPPLIGPSFGEYVDNVLITVDEAECDATPSWEGAPKPRTGTRWCRFRVTIANLSDETFPFDRRYQDLQTGSPDLILRPWRPPTRLPEPAGWLVGPVRPGDIRTGTLVFSVPEGAEMEFLGLTSGNSGISASARPHAFDCRQILTRDGAVCTYSSERALVRFRYMQSVELYHCGVEPFFFAGRRWVSDPPPFDATNAPADFTGTGAIELVTEKEAVYTDSSGVEIRLRADEEWDPPPCA